jgi:hypothetical protein
VYACKSTAKGRWQISNYIETSRYQKDNSDKGRKRGEAVTDTFNVPLLVYA